MPAINLSTDTLTGAIEALELQKRLIEGRIAELRAATNTKASPATGSPVPRKRRQISASARKRIAAAQQKRWDAFHENQAAEAAAAKKPAKRTMSAAGRKRIAAAQKKRWAAQRERAMAAAG